MRRTSSRSALWTPGNVVLAVCVLLFVFGAVSELLEIDALRFTDLKRLLLR